ncbi:transporter, hydrophobe/amphiphile efflux-1 (HAE1) family [Paludibacter propionicigenes WB4]|uniref:Transporter, hydrophobe/amphiphile efflux-1 (HAE1) family n=1 Tax=Paludibacter propionicigenes (strain DSM 17365 / JCM 13257 / WB4) TaxID=694427 RepID=E4T817_PALPW|nr:efflux RND transporter permease subunit [Paludibacter propionicigenes]ADQ80861.1 transporter, hydrophobe/amphiphile efflux-1 (HAE1) family [Paludibacter propionicigenes WB4]
MLKTFIERPVLSTVISVLFVVLGIIGIFSLPIEQYPNIAPPTVRVSTNYSGANADAVLKSVIVPLEEQINGVEGMTYMTSSAANGGTASINVFFKQGTNPDMAAVNVQNRVSQAAALLPSEVTRNGVTVQKQQSSTVLMIMLKSKNPDYDDKFMQNYVNINILPQIKRVMGVGDASVYGAKDYTMRVWLKPDVMKSYNITPSEVNAALQDQNIEAAPGELGANSNQSFQYALKYTGRLKNTEEFGNIIIRSKNSQVLRLKDVATLELGSASYSIFTRNNGAEAVVMAINQTAGSNAQDIIKDVKKVMEDAGKKLPKGISYEYQMDASEFLNASIEKVLHTLLEAFILVFIVVFLFLQNFRATLIPAIAVPVAIIGTFFFLLLFGFSINLLTLFALVLAIGIVVDDAIVVVEAVHAKMDAGMTDAKEAAIAAMGEIAPAIVSITLVMAAVFIPVSFIGGTSGVFFKQFGLTLSIAILISAVNALTLSPALCAIFLKTEHNPDLHDKSLIRRFYYYFNVGFAALTARYKKTLEFLGKKNHRWITVTIIVVFTAILGITMKIVPNGFVPSEDSGNVMGMISLSPGSSLERTAQVTARVTKIAESIPHVHNTISLTGLSFTSGMGSSYASVLIKMDPWNDRDISTGDVTALLKQRTDSIKDATFMFFGTPTLQGFGMSSGVELKMQDKTGGSVDKFYGVTTEFLNELRKRPEVMMIMNSFDPRFPQKQIEANIAKIKDAGLTLNDVMSALQAYVGSMYVSNFNSYGKQYRVVVQAAPQYRSKLDDLNGLAVKTSNGVMTPISEFITVKDVTGPQALTRFNLFSSMDVTVIPNYVKGYTSGDVLKALKEINLPEGYGYDFSGMTREEANSSNQTILIFGLCIIFVYLLLAALYESYILPLAVLLSLPIGLAGVFVFVFVSLMGGSGIVNNIYVQISLIMLIGLLAKNAILIVEYALQRRHQGMSIVKAAVEGATARLRPILMTSLAFIFGLLPLALATGAGAVGNKSIGISAIGGMLFGTVFGILVIPSLFIIFQNLHEHFSKTKIVTIDEHHEK